MKPVKTHHDLDVWKMSMEYVIDLYRITETFPSCEKFGLVSQVRRAGVSIPSNIAEGASRNTAKEFRYFITVALSSATELESELEIAYRLGFLKNIEKELALLTRIRKMLVRLRRSVDQRIRNSDSINESSAN